MATPIASSASRRTRHLLPGSPMPRLRTPLLALAAALAVAPPAAAQALNVVNVGARQLNCLFSPTCSVTVSDITAPYLGAGFLQSRVFQGQPGTVGAGKWV